MITIGVAAGHVKRPADIERLLRVPPDVLSSITLGSYTLEPKDGNPGNPFWTDGAARPTSINSLGLPNPGMSAIEDHFWTMGEQIRASGKQVRVSIAGFTPREYKLMAQMAMGARPFELELNLGCPNVWKDGQQKRITSFDLDLIRETLLQVSEVTDNADAPAVAVKLSVYSDPFLLEEVARLLSDMRHIVQSVVVCNTFPNGSGFDSDGKLLIDATDGYGGLAGNSLKYIALGQVRKFRHLLSSTIDVIGVGGISSGQDVLDMERAGASSVQVGTAYFTHGNPGIFVDIMRQYAEL